MTIMKILIGLLGLSIVVVVHEAGHFIAARLSGIKVEAFSVGWGKVIWARKWKETEFRISLFPLGGYCKMKGEQAMIQAWESKARTIETDPGDMYAASWWKRIIVSISGPLMNLIFAGLIFYTISFIGYNIYYYPSRIVLASDYNERQDYPADQSGLKSGDLIISINGEEIRRFDELQEQIMVNPDKNLSFVIQRDGIQETLIVTPELNKDSGAGYLGIYPWIASQVRTLSEESSLAAAGILPGDLILKINGQDIGHALDFSFLSEDERINSITVKRQDQLIVLDNLMISAPVNGDIQFEYLSMRTESGKIIPALRDSFKESYNTVENSLKGLALLFKGINLQSAVSGPLRITYMTGDLAFSGFSNGIAEGFLSFFRFIALINIALFIMNLLPIPVLDGGQILLFVAEGIFRKKPNPSLLYRYQMIGTVIVFALIIFATMNDILFFSRN